MFKRLVASSTTLLVSIVFLVTVVSAAIVHDGPISGDGLNPTAITVAAGVNTINSSVSTFPDVGYFTIAVPADHQLDAINLTAHTNGDLTSWFAAMSGVQFTENSTDTSEIDVGNMLGQSHIGSGNALPYNVMPSMGLNTPLAAGDYSFRIQNWGSGIDFTLDYVISPSVPTSVQLSGMAGSQQSFAQIQAIGLMGLCAITLVAAIVRLTKRD